MRGNSQKTLPFLSKIEIDVIKRIREVYFFQIDKCCKLPWCSNNPPFPFQNWNWYYKVCTEKVLFDTVKCSKTYTYLIKNAIKIHRQFSQFQIDKCSMSPRHLKSDEFTLLYLVEISARDGAHVAGSVAHFWRSMGIRMERSNVQNYENSTFWNFLAFSFSNDLKTLNEVVWDRYAPGYNLRC